MAKKPFIPGFIAVAAIYWGALYYWLMDDFSSGVSEVQNGAIIKFAISIPYVAFIMSGTMFDTPEPVTRIPIIGKYAKVYAWLAIMLLLCWQCPAFYIRARKIAASTA
jgi:hypothetical protein